MDVHSTNRATGPCEVYEWPSQRSADRRDWVSDQGMQARPRRVTADDSCGLVIGIEFLGHSQGFVTQPQSRGLIEQ